MPSVVDICNRALDKLGHKPITSLTDGNKAANICNRTWPIARDSALRDHPWNFAVKRATTAPLSTTPSWGFAYAHQLPADCLRLLEVRDLSTGEFQVEDNKILADDDVLYIRYIYRVEDPNVYDSSFVNCAASRMAFEMAEALNNNNVKKEAAWEEYMKAMRMAASIDAQENPPAEFEEDEWNEVRY